MAVNSFRILFLADTHLGFDFAFKPRIRRRRRGPDFFNNYKTALLPAQNGKVDCVVHGGDLFFRSRIPANLVSMAFSPLVEIAEKGIPVMVVPGNHERSNIPYRILAAHENIKIFDRPKTFLIKKEEITLAMAGFPYFRKGVRKVFANILMDTGWQDKSGHATLLCMHHCVEGAIVGPSNYTFRHNPDVIRGEDIPAGIQAVLTGHIHRFQVLHYNLAGEPLRCPVFYSGSIERTSIAEKDEEKGYLIIELKFNERLEYQGLKWKFHQLPSRPMVPLDLRVDNRSSAEVKRELLEKVHSLPLDSVVRIKIQGQPSQEVLVLLGAQNLRDLAPATMNISVSFPTAYRKGRFVKK